MNVSSIEIKARCHNPDNIRKILVDEKGVLKGTDHQVDTYFNVPYGRLKLREGTIENNLIHYNRENKDGPKSSDILLMKTNPEATLKDILVRALGVLVVVDKKREIFFINNVKFHIDDVKNLGTFVEIEALDTEGKINPTELEKQCQHYIKLLDITTDHMVSVSYSDLLLANYV